MDEWSEGSDGWTQGEKKKRKMKWVVNPWVNLRYGLTAE